MLKCPNCSEDSVERAFSPSNEDNTRTEARWCICGYAYERDFKENQPETFWLEELPIKRYPHIRMKPVATGKMEG